MVPTGGLSWGVPLAAGPAPSERGAAALGRDHHLGCQEAETASRPRDTAEGRLGAAWSFSSLGQAPQPLTSIPEGTRGVRLSCCSPIPNACVSSSAGCSSPCYKWDAQRVRAGGGLHAGASSAQAGA